MDLGYLLLNFAGMFVGAYLGATVAIRRHAVTKDEIMQLLTVMEQTRQNFAAVRDELRENGGTRQNN